MFPEEKMEEDGNLRIIYHLEEDEVVEKRHQFRELFSLKGYRIYVTNKRLIIVKGKDIRYIKYEHISKLDLGYQRQPFLILTV
jgi:hypothetical protein